MEQPIGDTRGRRRALWGAVTQVRGKWYRVWVGERVGEWREVAGAEFEPVEPGLVEWVDRQGAVRRFYRVTVE